MNETSESSFPRTRQDLSNLKTTAIDAAKDLSGTAVVHAKTAQGQLQDLASHAQEEGGAQLDQVKVSFYDVADRIRDYISVRPLASIGTALAVGFILGFSRRGR